MSKNNNRYSKEIPRKDSKRKSYALMLVKKYPKIKERIERGESVNGRDQAIYQVVSGAIYKTKFLPNGYDILEFIERKYWKHEEITVEEYAAEKVVDPKTVVNWLYGFTNMVLNDFGAEQMNYLKAVML